LVVPVIGVTLPYLWFGHALGFAHLPWQYYPILVGFVLTYLGLVEQAKAFFYKTHPVGAPVAEQRPKRVRRIYRRAARFSQTGPLGRQPQPRANRPPT